MPPIPSSIWSSLSEGAGCLPRACARVSEQFYVNQLMLAGNLFIETINGAKDDVNARVVTEIEFAFNDVRQLTDELMPEEQEGFETCFAVLAHAIDDLKAFVPFPPVERPLIALRRKLVERVEANDRSKFAPPEAPKEPLPHPPSSLQPDAKQVRGDLSRAGFETPVLDRLAGQPDQFEIRDCDALIEEIDTILG